VSPRPEIFQFERLSAVMMLSRSRFLKSSLLRIFDLK
jgi:hypothetical protein